MRSGRTSDRPTRNAVIRSSAVWRHLSTRLFVPVATLAHDRLLNWSGHRLAVRSGVRRDPASDLLRHGLQRVTSPELAALARQIREELADASSGPSAIDLARANMGAQGDSKHGRRGAVELNLSAETKRRVLDLAASDDVLGLVTAYFDGVPRVHHIGVTLTTAQFPEPRGSELWHRDPMGIRNCTLFMYLTEVGEHSGPFQAISLQHLPAATWLPRNAERRAVEAGLGPADWDWHRWTDEQMAAFVPRTAMQTVLGPAGTAFLVDQYAAFHRGGHTQAGDRLVLQVLFETSSKPGATEVTDLLDELSLQDQAEFLRTPTLRHAFSRSCTWLQQTRIPFRLRRLYVDRLTYHPVPLPGRRDAAATQPHP